MLEETPTPPNAVAFKNREAQVRDGTRKPEAEGHRLAQGMLPLLMDRPPGGPVLEEAPPHQGQI